MPTVVNTFRIRSPPARQHIDLGVPREIRPRRLWLCSGLSQAKGSIIVHVPSPLNVEEK
jgi:hypothetical protein